MTEFLDKYEIYGRVVSHLFTQGKKAIRGPEETPECRYRMGRLMCAAGCLIEDEFYDESFEGLNIAEPAPAAALLRSGVDTADRFIASLVFDLQDCHDNYDIGEWPERLSELGVML